MASIAASRIIRSSRLTEGRRSALLRKSLPVRAWTPTITFCSTVMLGNSARFWKVRPMPSAATWWGVFLMMDFPSKSRSPLLGV